MKIKDEFSNLKISRQYRYQLRQQKKGLCILCREKRVTAFHCRKHAKAHARDTKRWREKES